MVNWLAPWRWMQRHADRLYLWPICKEETKGDLILARGVFFVHMNLDPAYADMSEDEKIDYVESLT
jgi:hypothetical protein